MLHFHTVLALLALCKGVHQCTQASGASRHHSAHFIAGKGERGKEKRKKGAPQAPHGAARREGGRRGEPQAHLEGNKEEEKKKGRKKREEGKGGERRGEEKGGKGRKEKGAPQAHHRAARREEGRRGAPQAHLEGNK